MHKKGDKPYLVSCPSIVAAYHQSHLQKYTTLTCQLRAPKNVGEHRAT